MSVLPPVSNGIIPDGVSSEEVAAALAALAGVTSAPAAEVISTPDATPSVVIPDAAPVPTVVIPDAAPVPTVVIPDAAPVPVATVDTAAPVVTPEVVAAPVTPVVEAQAAPAETVPATTPEQNAAELSAVLHSQELARSASIAAQPAEYKKLETSGVLIAASSHASAREGFAALIARAKQTADNELHVMLSMVGTLLHLHSFASHSAAMTGTYTPADAN